MAFPRRATLPDPAAQPANPALCCEEDGLSNIFSDKYWRQLCPQLHVNDKQLIAKAKPFKVDKAIVKDLRSQIDDEGVFQVAAQQLPWSSSVSDMAAAVATLIQYGWPSSFLLVFDEVWAAVAQVAPLMKAATGNECSMDILAWYIDPNRGDAGFSPHRDRQPDDVASTFRPDGSAKYSTCWIPFTDACPENSCLYVVPRPADPGYTAGDAEDGPDPLQVALASKESYQHVRALPAEAGGAVVFTHRILHWGSKGRKGYHTPRVSMSFGCADDAYEPAYFSRQHLPFPPLPLRVALACAQMIVYHERFDMSGRQLAAFYEAFMQHSGEFHKDYRLKVVAEFVAASKEVTAKEAAAAAKTGAGAADSEGPEEQQGGKARQGSRGSARPAKRIKVLDDGHHESEPDEDDVLDMALDAMLEARMEGCDEFADDFDDDGEGLEGFSAGGFSDEEDEDEDEDDEGLEALLGTGGQAGMTGFSSEEEEEEEAGGRAAKERGSKGQTAGKAVNHGPKASEKGSKGAGSKKQEQQQAQQQAGKKKGSKEVVDGSKGKQQRKEQQQQGNHKPRKGQVHALAEGSKGGKKKRKAQ